MLTAPQNEDEVGVNKTSGNRVIDFRIRPPYKDFLQTVMYTNGGRRNDITRKIGFVPSRAAEEHSVPLLLAEMDAARIERGVVVGRNSGALGAVAKRKAAFCEQKEAKKLCYSGPVPFQRHRPS
jgi:hypothetical protein